MTVTALIRQNTPYLLKLNLRCFFCFNLLRSLLLLLFRLLYIHRSAGRHRIADRLNTICQGTQVTYYIQQ